MKIDASEFIEEMARRDTTDGTVKVFSGKEIIEIIYKASKPLGKWIGGELGECSICGHEGCASDIWTGCEKTYCPNCGNELEGTGI